MSSGSGYVIVSDLRLSDDVGEDRGGEESVVEGLRVIEDEELVSGSDDDSSVSEVVPTEEGEYDRNAAASLLGESLSWLLWLLLVLLDNRRARILCTICLSLKCLSSFCGPASIGCDHFTTVSRIALVISAWLVYGQQMFNIASPFPLVSSTARSIASNTSGLISSRCPRICIRAPYCSSRSPCCTSCASFTFAMSISASTSYLDRLKFSIEKA